MAEILVLAGGNSAEREVSLRSGKAVAAALRARGNHVLLADPASDDWLTMAKASQAVFPALHGKGGEDGSTQKELEKLAIPFVGSGSNASGLCFNKWRYQQFLSDKNINMPTSQLVDITNFAASPLASRPFVLKPIDGGSSLDTLIVRDISKLDQTKIDHLLAKYSQMIIQQLITGVEITVGILGDKALPVIEIIPPVNGEFDYANKYNGESRELCPPKNVARQVQKKVQALALKVHELCDCQDLSRSDFIVRGDGELYLLETNTMPGMTNQSLFPKAAATIGLPMPELCEQLIGLALGRSQSRF